MWVHSTAAHLKYTTSMLLCCARMHATTLPSSLLLLLVPHANACHWDVRVQICATQHIHMLATTRMAVHLFCSCFVHWPVMRSYPQDPS